MVEIRRLKKWEETTCPYRVKYHFTFKNLNLKAERKQL